MPCRPPTLELAALTVVLAGAHLHVPGEQSYSTPAGRSYPSGLERRLRQRDAELAAAGTEFDRLEMKVARMQACLNRAGCRNGGSASAANSRSNRVRPRLFHQVLTPTHSILGCAGV